MPLTLQVDRVERVWSPTPKLTHVLLMSDLGTSCSSINQSEREEEEGGGGGGGGGRRGRSGLRNVLGLKDQRWVWSLK